MDTGENVVIVVSGESGSGKTEACRQVMRFVTYVTDSSDERIEFVKKVLVQSSDLLEAFGNAKTRMNYNSSRFGKLMALNFNHAGQPVSGHIVTYILEPRVVSPGYDERNCTFLPSSYSFFSSPHILPNVCWSRFSIS